MPHTYENCKNSDYSTVRTAIKREATALRRTFSIHEDNSDVRKFVVFVLIVTWSAITVGIAFNEASTTPTYSMLTALIWALVGRMWGGEVKDVATAE